MEWHNNFVRLSDLYIYEFNVKKLEGEKVATGIMNYLTSNSLKVQEVLDIPCGIGRISQYFLKLGIDVTGVDLSQPFLDEFRKTAENQNLSSPTLVNANFKNFLAHINIKKFDLILNWWTSFGYSSYTDDKEFFAKLLNVAHKDTILMVESWHKDFILNHKVSTSYKDLGKLIVVNENAFEEEGCKVSTTHKYYEKREKDLIFLNEFKSSIKLYSKEELISLMQESGWRILDYYNDIESRDPFNLAKDRIVLILKPL